MVGDDVEAGVDRAEHQVEVEQDGLVTRGWRRGSAARLTAREVTPTPPAAPVTAMTWGPLIAEVGIPRGRGTAARRSPSPRPPRWGG